MTEGTCWNSGQDGVTPLKQILAGGAGGRGEGWCGSSQETFWAAVAAQEDKPNIVKVKGGWKDAFNL